MNKQTLLFLALLAVGTYNSRVNSMSCCKHSCCKRPEVLLDEEEYIDTSDTTRKNTSVGNTLVRSPMFTDLNELLNIYNTSVDNTSSEDY